MPTWTDEMTIQFINEVRVRPQLWDVENLVYKNREAKRKCWAKVAEQFEVTPNEAYMKFKNLRTYAKNEHKKHKGKRVSWFAYDAISFILPPNGDMATGGKDTARSMTSDWALSEDEIIVKDPLMLLPKEITYKKAKTNRNQQTQTTFESTKTADVNAGRSLYSGFGEHVANKLNTYDRYTRSQVEFRISQILFDADMGLYSKDTDDPHLAKIEILNNQDDNI